MKTRSIKLPIDTTLTLHNAYGKPRACYAIKAGEITEVAIPLRREYYTDETGKIYYIYDGVGVLETFDLPLPDFALDETFIDGFDNFLASGKSETHQAIYSQILAVMDNYPIIADKRIFKIENEILKRLANVI
ncbi:hypothetical protein [Helicobacter sp. 11S02596-1]|uniref:hypothetical protein n=1 Tax=Helicobacter sp. 11S02596-1 TaxID=1476194 RepID=UPI000BA74783|nr:hypothetical protein [Helicobacter sp. 11S02596-1]PAF41129.1 hypothetical protein BJI48_09045 [Helicobacter sp. 11S02596-1]